MSRPNNLFPEGPETPLPPGKTLAVTLTTGRLRFPVYVYADPLELVPLSIRQWNFLGGSDVRDCMDSRLRVGGLIHTVRGMKVILDRDLARLYGVTTGNLNKAVRRNRDRFPSDFMLVLTPAEYRSLRFQIGILEAGRHSKYLPMAFTTEHGSRLGEHARLIQEGFEAIRALMEAPEPPAKHIGFRRQERAGGTEER